MKQSVTGFQMKQIDRETIGQIGIPSMVLMERAALAVADAVKELAVSGKERIWMVCGTGNNGADGIAAGRILQGHGYDVTVILAGSPERGTQEYQWQRRIAEKLELPVWQYDGTLPGTCGVMADGLFGIGLDREISGDYRELIEQLKRLKETQGIRSVAIDIPSGIHADTGEVMGTALPADITVTFGFLKTGLCVYPGKEFAGRVVTADIGFPQKAFLDAGWDCQIPEPSDLSLLPERNADSNKGTYGKLLVIAGSVGMSGAAFLAALAAYRAGTGLVRVLTVEENREILQNQLPEAILETYRTEEALRSSEAFRRKIEESCGWASAIVIGPGLSVEPYTERLLELVLTHAYVPVVLDADALNVVAAHPSLASYFTDNIVITPHPGEMARLLGTDIPRVRRALVDTARACAARHGITCVLKDAVTVTAEKDGRTWLNSSGNCGMAKAGSGDVLAGVIGGLLAQGMELPDAAWMGVYLHGLAGDHAVRTCGTRGLLARQLADALTDVWREE